MKPVESSVKRVAYSPGEFAALFGKSQTWGYRQMYAGKVTTITAHGRILIPAAEVERILAEAGIYNGEKKNTPKKVSKADLWKHYIASQRKAKRDGTKPKGSAALARLRTVREKVGDGKPARFKKR